MRIAEVTSRSSRSPGCGGDPNSKCGNGLEKIFPTTAVRYGEMKYIGEFTYQPGMQFTCGGKVVVQTDRGIEIGEQVSLTCTGCSKSVSREQMRDYAAASGEGYLNLNSGKILREATSEDLHEDRHIRQQSREKLKRCKQVSRNMNLPMKMVECEHLFGGERIIFYFMAEGRVDFRDLVKELAQEYHTRIEMRQIGARDEARLVADYETCGQECCCKKFLKTLKPISMRMAKLQKATLDPSKVSGRCGRLKCCLRYEHETYEELDKKLPRVGARIKSSHGDGIVVDRQILTQLVQIETDDNRRLTVVMEDITEINGTPAQATDSKKVQRQELASAPSDADSKPDNQKQTDEATLASQSTKKKRKRRRRPRQNRKKKGTGDTQS